MVIVIMELLLHHVCREIVGTGQETRKLYELAKRTMISTKMARVHADWELFSSCGTHCVGHNRPRVVFMCLDTLTRELSGGAAGDPWQQHVMLRSDPTGSGRTEGGTKRRVRRTAIDCPHQNTCRRDESETRGDTRWLEPSRRIRARQEEIQDGWSQAGGSERSEEPQTETREK